MHVAFLETPHQGVVVTVWRLDLQLPLQSVTINTNVVSTNPTHARMYSIQHFVIKFVSNLRQIGFYFSSYSDFLHQ